MRRLRCTIPLLAALLGAALLTACARTTDQEYSTQLLALGTLVEISLWGVGEEAATPAVQAVEATLNEIHHRWHAWEPGPLTRLNAALAAGRPAEVDPETAAVIARAAELARASGQLFNPALGRLIALWGFHSDEPPQGPPPPQPEIARLLQAAPSMDDLTIKETTITSRNPSLQLDFGAFAKGYGVDRAIEALRDLGIENAIVNAGGDLRAIGRHGDRPWRIGIRHPTAPGIIASIETRGDESVFTSGNYERYFDFQGRRYHHIIDPRTGYPAEGAVSVTVIHRDGATADAAATALFVAGPRGWRATARRLGITQAMLIDTDLTVHMTRAMAGRVHFETDPPPRIEVSDAP